jgi:L-asparaginase
MVAADDLSPWKARVLLMLGLTMTVDHAELQAMFDRY